MTGLYDDALTTHCNGRVIIYIHSYVMLFPLKALYFTWTKPYQLHNYGVLTCLGCSRSSVCSITSTKHKAMTGRHSRTVGCHSCQVNPFAASAPVHSAFFLFLTAAKPNGPGREDAWSAIWWNQPLLAAATRASHRAWTPAGRLLPRPGLRTSWASEVSDGDAEPNTRHYKRHAIWTAGQ